MIARDKRGHAAAGFALGLLAFIHLWLGIAAVLLAMLGKEAKDARGLPWLKRRWPAAPAWLVDRGCVELADILYGIAGGAVSVLLAAIIC